MDHHPSAPARGSIEKTAAPWLGMVAGSLMTGSLMAGALLAAAPVAAQERTFVIAMVGTPKGLDPDIWVPGQIESSPNVYEGLTKFATKQGPDGRLHMDTEKVIPHMAESWTVSPDGKEYVFKLREKVLSPFGNEMTAADVVFGFEKSASQNRTGHFIRTVSRVTKVEAVSKYEVKFTLSDANRIFLGAITNHVPGIFDSTEAKKHATAEDPFATRWLGSNTAGFGAYHMESNQAGQQAVYVLNKNYTFPKPYYTRVIWREVPSAATRVALVKSGQVQYAEQIPLNQIVDLRKDKSVKVESVPGSGSATVRMNPKYPPFDNLKFRQAVAYATDYNAIGEAVFLGLGTRSRGMLSDGIPGYIEAYKYETNIEKAKQLLVEAGMPNGADVTLEYSANWWWEEPIALQMQAALAKANIRVTPKRITNTEHNTRRAITSHTLPFFTYMTTPFVPDPSYAMFLSAHTKGVSNGNANSFPDLDRAIDQSFTERDDAKWRAVIAEAQKLEAEYATFIETYLPGTHEVFTACVDGFVWKPHNRLVWRDLVCKQ